jgi:hypothetical protein
VIAGAVHSKPLTQLSAGVYLLTAPVIHLVNGSFNKGAASFVLRLMMPLGGAIVGTMLCGGEVSSDRDCTTAITLGAVGGAAGAILLDTVFLAKKEVPAGAASLRLYPLVATTPQGGTFGLGGAW